MRRQPVRPVLLRILAAVALLLVLPAPPALGSAPAGPVAAAGAPRVVPALASWSAGAGTYRLTEGSRLLVRPGDRAARETAGTLAGDLAAAGHHRPPVKATTARPAPGDLLITVDPARAAELGAEGYALDITDRTVITGATGTGAFHSTRTLLQMLAMGTRIEAGHTTEIAAGHTVDVPAYPERGVGVCACYIHVSLPWLENLIRDMSYLKLNQLLLELKVRSDTHPEANTWGYYTKDEVRRIVALGKKYHVTVVPEINSPGHLDPWIENRPDLQLTDVNGTAQPSRLDITSEAAFDYYTSLMDEYAEVFTSPWWHMGADEYMLGSDYAAYPQVLAHARRRFGDNATAQDAYVDFVNRVGDHAAALGKRLRIWNDGLTGENTVPVRTDAVVEHWISVRTTPAQLIAEGHQVMNASYALYLIRGGFSMDTRSLYEQGWNPTVFEGSTVSGPAGVTGAKISFWPDNGRAQTENEAATAGYLPLRYLAQTTWGTPAPDTGYPAFAARAEAIGRAPGVEVAAPPLPPGEYTVGTARGTALGSGSTAVGATLTASAGADGAWRLGATEDGYLTLVSGTTGLCAETRTGRLSVNTPLEAGTPLTQQTCSAANRLQRWQLEPAAGGYHLVNAITRMAAYVTTDGRVTQYPPDQRPPTVWQFTAR